jgi:SAM-dependent methyltransferase
MTGNRTAWESRADDWLSRPRTPGHDAYWYYRNSFFESIAPPPRGITLEVGCGEGRVARDLVARGHRVVAIDGSPGSSSPGRISACVWFTPSSLGDYFAALAEAGFVVESLREPLPEGGGPDYVRRHRFPMFLHLRAVMTRK